jgi:hypothetical protein
VIGDDFEHHDPLPTSSDESKLLKMLVSEAAE